MLNYKKINDLLSDRNVIKNDFYSDIDMTSSGFTKMMELKRMKVETLEKIAMYFKKPISWFFDEEIEYNDINQVAEPQSGYEQDNKYLTLLERYSELQLKYSTLLEKGIEQQEHTTKSPAKAIKSVSK